MKLSKQLKKQIDLAVKASFKNSKLDEKKAQEFTKLFRQLPEAVLALGLYLKGIKRELNKTTLTIETAVSISSQEAKQIADKMKKHFTITSSHITHNPLLLGGLRVKIGDTVLDDSLKAKIQEVRSAIVS